MSAPCPNRGLRKQSIGHRNHRVRRQRTATVFIAGTSQDVMALSAITVFYMNYQRPYLRDFACIRACDEMPPISYEK